LKRARGTAAMHGATQAGTVPAHDEGRSLPAYTPSLTKHNAGRAECVNHVTGSKEVVVIGAAHAGVVLNLILMRRSG